jgi:hypothetical protein
MSERIGLHSPSGTAPGGVAVFEFGHYTGFASGGFGAQPNPPPLDGEGLGVG